MDDERNPAVMASPMIMFVSAAIFGYFGFMTSFPEVDVQTGKLIPLVVTLKWTLRASAVAFAASALLTLGNAFLGNLVYAVLGLVSAIALGVVGVWDVTEPKYGSGVSPFLLFLFAAWNGYGSWTGLQALRGAAGRREPSRGDNPPAA